MSDTDFLVLLLTLFGLLMGSWSIYWARSDAGVLRIRWGRRMFLAALLELGATALLAAWINSLGLAPLGLASVFLVVAMVWETPATEGS